MRRFAFSVPANGGFQAEFRDHRIGFPRQELMCPQGVNDIAGCAC